MYCSQFKNHYSELRDGMIRNEQFHRGMKAHLENCDSCARFDRSLNEGVSLIYRSGEILVPPGFKDRIMKSVKVSESVAQPVTPAPAGFAAAGMVAAAIALLVFEYQLVSTPVAQVSIPAAEVLHTQLVAPPVIPMVSFTELELPPIVELQPLPEVSPRAEDEENNLSSP
jgi:hypothetical protein